MSQLCPISLCNAVYKVISKVLAYRIKILLPHIISQDQNAFVPRMTISKNTILAFEIANFLYERKMGKKRRSFFALKFYMCKAYDKIEWHYLKSVLLKIGYNTKWVNFLMMCVSSVSSSFMVNENLSAIIERKEQCGAIQGFLFV
ncbi:hypothetical protein ACFX13_020173 [Malus domestica]